jgi:hypothetical protein
MKRPCVTYAAFVALLLCVAESHAFGRRGGRGGCATSHGGCAAYSGGCGVSYGGYAPSYGGYTTPVNYAGYSAPVSHGGHSMPMTYSGPASYSMPMTYSGPTATYDTPICNSGSSLTSYSSGPIQPGQWIRTETGWAQVISVGPSKEAPREIRRMPEPEKEGGKKPKAPSIDD